MSLKIQNKEKCPCGSNLKYSKCCKLRKDENFDFDKYIDNEKRLNAEITSLLRKNKFSACLHPNKQECSGTIIAAHSIQNNGILSLLADNGNVIVLEPGVGLEGLKMNYLNKGKSKSTTFSGFCSYHDREIFKPIELSPYNKDNDEQNFLFAYRAFMFEYYKKKVAFKTFQQTIRKLPSRLNEKEFVALYRNYQLSNNDMESYYSILNDALNNSNFGIIKSNVIELNYQIKFATTFIYSPLFDFNKNKLNYDAMVQFSKERLKLNFVTIFPQENTSIIIYSWLAEDNEYFQTIESSLSSENITEMKRIFNNIIPEYSENIVFSPKFWENLSEAQKKEFNMKIVGESSDPYNSMINKMYIDERPGFNLFRKFDW